MGPSIDKSGNFSTAYKFGNVYRNKPSRIILIRKWEISKNLQFSRDSREHKMGKYFFCKSEAFVC